MKSQILTKTNLFILAIILTTSCSISLQGMPGFNDNPGFNQERAYRDVEYQVNLGPRVPGSRSHEQVVEWIHSELNKSGWIVEIQSTSRIRNEIINLIAQRSQTSTPDSPWLILGAHYDSRIFADRDPQEDNRKQPVPGANDGASGVAVLLELARNLPKDIRANIWLVFFDAEDNGNISGWEWILGSSAFVEELQGSPDAAVIVDMIGDTDLNIYLEKNSDQELAGEIWGKALELGYSNQFIPEVKYSLIDDHIPFLQAGVPAVDIIDFDYPYHHTIGDTSDKVSPESLGIVGKVLLSWLLDKYYGS